MFKQSSIFEYRLEDEAINLRKQAEGMPHGIRRDELLRKAGQIDADDRALQQVPHSQSPIALGLLPDFPPVIS